MAVVKLTDLADFSTIVRFRWFPWMFDYSI